MSDEVTIDAAPWTLKGVSPEARSAAIGAAKRAGMPIGLWSARALLQTAQTEAKGSRELVKLPEDMPSLAPAVALAPALSAAPMSLPRESLSDAERVALVFMRMAEAGVPVSKRNASKVQRHLIAQLGEDGK